MAAAGFFPSTRIPAALTATLAVGYVVLLSPTFRAVIAGIPQHWLIGIQTFRILGGVFLIRYFNGELPALFAVPAGVGDVLTGVLAPLVAYWWFVGKPYARSAAIAWNLFGMADLMNAVALGALTGVGGGGIVFPGSSRFTGCRARCSSIPTRSSACCAKRRGSRNQQVVALRHPACLSRRRGGGRFCRKRGPDEHRAAPARPSVKPRNPGRYFALICPGSFRMISGPPLCRRTGQ